jgi:hypothetical protein
MFKYKPALVGSLVAALAGALCPLACAPAQPTGVGAAGGTAGAGGTTGPSGCSAASVGGGGQGGYTSTKCPDANPADLPVDGFPRCTMNACQAAHCIPSSLVPASVDKTLLANCDASSLCVPDDYAKSLGRFKVRSCTSLNNMEGRCISTCVPKVNGLMDVLPKANCGDYEVCAPCYNPNDGTSTGACSQGCDTGPTRPSTQFPKCQAGAGVCVAPAILPPVLLTQLVQYDCPLGNVCAPTLKSQNLKANFLKCQPSNILTAALAGIGPNGQTGGCVPAWLADANPLEGIFMAQDTCQLGEKCAPCNNPLRGGVPTGACPVPLCSDPNGGVAPL